MARPTPCQSRAGQKSAQATEIVAGAPVPARESSPFATSRLTPGRAALFGYAYRFPKPKLLERARAPELRAEGMTIVETADALGVHPESVRNWTRGERLRRLALLAKHDAVVDSLLAGRP